MTSSRARPYSAKPDLEGEEESKQSKEERRRLLVEAEVERIRRQVDANSRVRIERLVVKGHSSKYEDETQAAATDDEINLTPTKSVDSDLIGGEVGLSISKAFVKSTKDKGAMRFEEDGDSSGYESHHDYQFLIEEKFGLAPKSTEIDLSKVIRIQALIRGFLARLKFLSAGTILYSNFEKREGKTVRFKLVKRKWPSAR